MLTLRRALGRWDLTAIGVNQVIGGAIFLMPSQVAAQIGAWSPIAFVLMGLASLTVALCFAELGSRFDGTGGPYLYTRAAFGRFVAFEVGWMQWFTRAASQASVMAGIALALGYYWPAVTVGVAANAAARRRDGGADLDQRARHPSERVAGERVDDRQAAAARDLHHRRSTLRGRQQADDAAAGDDPGILGGGAADDLRVRRVRRHSGAGGRSARPAPARAVRARADDPDGDGRDDARTDRRAGCAAGSTGAQHADCRCGGGIPRRRRSAPRRRRFRASR